jgi:hypothetical protein
MDANGTVFTAANWLISNVPLSWNFQSITLKVLCGNAYRVPKDFAGTLAHNTTFRRSG